MICWYRLSRCLNTTSVCLNRKKNSRLCYSETPKPKYNSSKHLIKHVWMIWETLWLCSHLAITSWALWIHLHYRLWSEEKQNSLIVGPFLFKKHIKKTFMRTPLLIILSSTVSTQDIFLRQVWMGPFILANNSMNHAKEFLLLAPHVQYPFRGKIYNNIHTLKCYYFRETLQCQFILISLLQIALLCLLLTAELQGRCDFLFVF